MQHGHDPMTNPRISTYLVISVLILTGCTLILDQHTTVTISSTPGLYSPLMSSTVGIRLTPQYEGPPSTFLQYHWTTDYGTFVRWDPPDYTVTGLGRDTITTNGTVYWQYIPELHGKEPDVVRIRLSVEDAGTGRAYGSAKTILTWSDTGYKTSARVSLVD